MCFVGVVCATPVLVGARKWIGLVHYTMRVFRASASEENITTKQLIRRKKVFLGWIATIMSNFNRIPAVVGCLNV